MHETWLNPGSKTIRQFGELWMWTSYHMILNDFLIIFDATIILLHKKISLFLGDAWWSI